MKTLLKLLAGGWLATALSNPAQAQILWQGGGSTLNWGEAANWTFGVPGQYDTAYFEDAFGTAYTNAAGLVNNIVDGNRSVATLLYTANSAGLTNHFYTTLIPAGSTLTLGGFGFSTPALAVGDVPGSSAWLNSGSWTNYATLKGAGSLAVNDSGGLVSVSMRNRATLDLTGLNSFSANVQKLFVGASFDNPNSTGPTGALLLGPANTITTTPNPSSPGVLLGSANGGNCTGVVLLGGTNNFNTDGLTVGGRRAIAGTLLAFGPAYSNTVSPGTFRLRGSAGGSSRADTFSIGDMAAEPGDFAGSPAGSSTGVADFTGGTVDIRANNIFVGRSAADTGTGGGFTYGFGTLIFERGTVDVNRLNIGYKQGTNLSSSLNGSSGVVPCVVTLKSNVSMTVNQDVSLGFRNNGTNGSQMPAGQLTINDSATANIGGSITSPTNGMAILQLGGGTVNMTGGNITVVNLTGSGNVTGAGAITVRSNLIPGATLGPGTLNLGGNLVLPPGVPLTFDLGANNTVGSGINDYVNVTGGVTFNNNPLAFTFAGPLSAGTYHLIDFTGTRSGLLALNNATRSQLGLDQTTPGHVDLIVTNWSPATLKWVGNANANPTNNLWNAGDTNWSNGGSPDRFYQMDDVVFDDTAVMTNIYPNGALYPASITINGSKNFALTNRGNFGPPYVGSINGACTITKNSSGTFLMGCYSNISTGPIYVNNGILKPFDPTFTTPGNNNVLGATNAVMYVTNTGTFDYNGIGSISSGKPIVIKGTGFNGLGAITNSVSNSGATMNGYFLSLAGDATVSADVGGWGIRGLGSSGPFYSGSLKLNGYTLTKLGAARFQMQEVVATDAGNINFMGGNLSLRNTLLTGSGNLTFGSGTYMQFPYLVGATSYVSKAISTAGTFGIAAPDSGNQPGQVLVDSTISMGGDLSITNNQVLILGGAISGGFGLAKYGNSNLVLNAANTFNGPTLVNAGTLSLGAGGSLNNTPLVTINPGATLDVSAKAGSFATVSGQKLILNGTAVGGVTIGNGSTLIGAGVVNGSLTIGSGAEVAPMTTNVVGTIVVSNSLALNGAHFTWELAPSFDISDAFVVGGDLKLSGVNTFTVNSIGGFDASGTNTVITYNGTLTGGLANLALNTDARFQVEFVDPALTPGKIQIRLLAPSPLLTWKGGAAGKPSTWDIKTTANWDNGGSPDVFWNSDLVRFDDTALTNGVDLVGILGPGSVSMENSSASYTFRGAGSLVSSSLANQSGSLTIANSADNFLTGAGLLLNGGTVTLAQPTNATLRANLSGFGRFSKAGPSALTLIGNANSFYGPMNIDAGTLRAGSPDVLGLGYATVAPGATLDVNGQLLQSSAFITVSGAGADGQGAINNRGAARTNALANVVLAGDTTVGAASNAWGIVGGLYGGYFTLTKTNANDVWIMTGNDTDLGAVEILQGRLVFSGEGTTTGTKANSINVRPNATLAFATTNAMPQSGLPPAPFEGGRKPIFLQNGAALESIGFPVNRTSTNSYSGVVTISNTAIFRVGGNSYLALSGSITGTNGQIIVTNGGTLLLTGENTYTSNTLVYSGTLLLPTNIALPANTSLYISNRVSTFGNPALGLADNVVMPADRRLIVSTLNTSATIGGDGTWNGPITFAGGNAFGIYGGTTLLDLAGPLITTNASGAFAFHGSNIRLAGSLILGSTISIGVGDGLSAAIGERFTSLRLEKTNNWTGVTQFDRGRITIGTNNALPPGVPFNQIGTLNAGVSDRRVLFDLNGYNQTFTSIREVFPENGFNAIGNNSTNSDSTVTFAGTGTNTWTLKLVDTFDNPEIPHKLGLTVVSGMLETLTANTYTGPTLVSGGKFLVSSVVLSALSTLNGSLDATPVTVNGTGTFGGNGYVAGSVTIGAGGTLTPGDSFSFSGSSGTLSTPVTRIGQLTLGGSDLTLGAGSRAVFEADPSKGTNDLVAGIGIVSYGGTLIITNLSGADYYDGQVLKLFDAAIYGGGFSSIVFPGVLAYDDSKLAVDGTIKVVTAFSSAPVPVAFSITGGNTLNLNWPYNHTGWRLQGQTNSPGAGIGTNWVTIPGSTTVNSMSFPMDAVNGSVFYRLVYP